MKQDDQIIKEFFHRMKEEDEKLSIPKIPISPPIRFRRWISLGIAASFLALLTISFVYWKKQKVEDYTFVIILSEQSETTSKSLVVQEPLMELWESPTQSLIDDFN